MVRSRRGRSMVCDSTCGKCKLQREVEQLTILVFEWPLPEEDVVAQDAIVFETLLPSLAFAELRDGLHQLASSMGFFSTEQIHMHTSWAAFLQGYPIEFGQTFKVCLGSDVKPTSKSHYKELSATLYSCPSLDQVIVKCGMHCGWASDTNMLSSEMPMRAKWAKHFALPLSPPYSFVLPADRVGDAPPFTLNDSIRDWTHDQNQVLVGWQHATLD
jgi:hypothetical protein